MRTRQWRYAVCPAEVTMLVVVFDARRKVGGDGGRVVDVEDGGHPCPNWSPTSKPPPSVRKARSFCCY